MTYIPAFDGLRAFAALIVVAFHAKLGWASGGFLGVDIFFVLSGFLITSILRGTDGIRYGNFLRRRLERLYPALLLFFLVMVFAMPIFWKGRSVWEEIIPAALYLSNYARLFTGAPDVLRHTWSLGVEFQFYLIWPFVIALLLRSTPQRALAVLVFLYMVIWAWRMVAYVDFGWNWAYAATDTRIGGLVLGGVVAYVPRIKGKAGYGLEILGVILLIIALSNSVYYVPNTAFYFTPMAEIGAALVIYSLASGKTVLTPVLATLPMRKLGHWSYGIYLWHYPVAFYMRDAAGPMVTFWVSVVVAIVMAALSYEFFETRVRDALRPQQRIPQRA
ncbi:MAG: acyltransferase [Rhodobacteraceae bacterium]|nr:acyltransferase [Paracoccaceae bacterium]